MSNSWQMFALYAWQPRLLVVAYAWRNPEAYPWSLGVPVEGKRPATVRFPKQISINFNLHKISTPHPYMHIILFHQFGLATFAACFARLPYNSQQLFMQCHTEVLVKVVLVKKSLA